MLWEFCVAYWVNMPSFNLANWCTYNVKCLLFSIGKYVDWACANTLKHGRITVSGSGYFHKTVVFCGKKMFQRQIQEAQYTIPIRHITNISDFVLFQRSCGSMKSVSSFSSIDTLYVTISIQSGFFIKIEYVFYVIIKLSILHLLLAWQNHLWLNLYLYLITNIFCKYWSYCAEGV